MNKKRLYWFIQIFGWSTYAAFYIVGGALMAPEPDPINPIVFSTIVFEAAIFLGITHFYRYIIINQGWLQLPFSKSIPRILVTIVVLALPIYPLKVAFSYALNLGNPDLWNEMLWATPSNIFFLFLWTVFYFMFHYFDRYNQSLKYEAAMREMELAHLKSQLNPHFIFNALNSIRALVDENPKRSKTAITQLSNILRSSLVGEKKGLTKFEEEFRTVKDYLELEATRYEERLKTEFDIHPDSYDFLVPPLMLQTLVENGVKHGISSLKKGGVIKLRTFVEDGLMHIQIRNSGQFVNGEMQNPGFGINNTKQRLKLIYGNKAHFSIFNENSTTVLTIVKIPQTETHESFTN